MTRKDYIVIAEALRVSLHRERTLPYGNGDNRSAEAQQAVLDVACEVADALKRDNSRFNREHFLAVVRGERELHSRPSRGGAL